MVGIDGEYMYTSYLFFDISAIPSNVFISNAELVLFKTNNFYNDSKKEFYISPLSEYFSTYTTLNNSPKENKIIKTKFYPIISKVAVIVNLSYLVSLWCKNQLRNTGIALYCKKQNILAEFGSAINKDSYLTPFINVATNPIINERCCNKYPIENGTTKQIQVIGTVAAASKYAAIVNVGVIRGGSGNTDNYYVADEYDNLTSGTPLNIDKTYNVAIIPKESPGDVETISFYGSYKE